MCCCNKQCPTIIVVFKEQDLMELAKSLPHTVIVDKVLEILEKRPSPLADAMIKELHV